MSNYKKKIDYLRDTKLIDEWDYERNGAINPYLLTCGSEKSTSNGDGPFASYPPNNMSRYSGNPRKLPR